MQFLNIHKSKRQLRSNNFGKKNCQTCSLAGRKEGTCNHPKGLDNCKELPKQEHKKPKFEIKVNAD